MNTPTLLLLSSVLGGGAQLFFYVAIALVALKIALIVDNWRQSRVRQKPKDTKQSDSLDV